AVALRDAWMARQSMQKWAAMGRAALDTLRRFPVVRLTLRLPEGSLNVTTPMVFIGNNRYETKLFSLGKRPALDEGDLWVYLARDAGRFRFLRLALRLVARSGHLTQRARAREFRAARAFLDNLPGAVLVVPGNHHVPLWDVVSRFARPLHNYRRYLTPELAPFFHQEDLAVMGV